MTDDDAIPSCATPAEPEYSARDAFFAMVALSRADGTTSAEERRIVESFREHMGLPRMQARRYWRAVRKQPGVPSTHDERVAVMSMLARVAWADGALAPSERRLLEDLAEAFELKDLRLAELLGKAKAEALHRRTQHRRWLGVAAVLLAGLVAVVVIASRRAPDGDEMAVFKALQQRHAPAMALVQTRYVLLRGSDRRRMESYGSGFFVSADGHLVTNKHVLQPWKFPGAAADLVAEGFEVEHDTVEIRVWPEGARLPPPGDSIDPGECCSSVLGSVTVVAVGEDLMQRTRRRNAQGAIVDRVYHAHDNNDLAILRCDLPEPTSYLTLVPADTPVTALDPVMVMGYPRGRSLVEGSQTISSPTVGRVRTADDTIHITAPIVGGNSGGPLLDTQGRVLGIATRTRGEATLGCCIRAHHVARLLPDALRQPR